MKKWFCGGALAVGLVLTVGEVRAAMGQGSPGGSPQQSAAPTQQMDAPKPSGGSPQQNSTPSHVTTEPRSSGGSMRESRVIGPRPPGGVVSQPNHGVVGLHSVPNQNWTGRRAVPGPVGRFGHGGDFDHDRFHHGNRHFIVVFVNGLPCWYPVYTDYPYYGSYYDVPPPQTYDNVSYANNSSYVPPADTTTPDTSDAQAAPSYGDLGWSWGQDLRRDIVAWDQFIAYLKATIITAPPAGQAEFREGFISSYGVNGSAAFDKAATQAAGPPAQQAPKIINMPPAN